MIISDGIGRKEVGLDKLISELLCEAREDESPPGYARWRVVFDSHDAANEAVRKLGSPPDERKVELQWHRLDDPNLKWRRVQESVRAPFGVNGPGPKPPSQSHGSNKRKAARSSSTRWVSSARGPKFVCFAYCRTERSRE